MFPSLPTLGVVSGFPLSGYAAVSLSGFNLHVFKGEDIKYIFMYLSAIYATSLVNVYSNLLPFVLLPVFFLNFEFLIYSGYKSLISI